MSASTRRDRMVAEFVNAGHTQTTAEAMTDAIINAIPVGALAESDVRDIAKEEIAANPASTPSKSSSRGVIAALTIGLVLSVAANVGAIMGFRATSEGIVATDIKMDGIMRNVDGLTQAGYVTAADIDTKIAAIPAPVIPPIPDGTGYAADYMSRLDQDGDGIFGADDQCPDISGVRGDGAIGCPNVDSDSDSVADYADHCPATPDGEKDKVVDDFSDAAWVYAADIAADPDNGCSDLNEDGYRDDRILAIVKDGKSCTGIANAKETKAASAPDVKDDEGTLDYLQCNLGQAKVTVTCTYVGESPTDCKVNAG